MVICCLLIACGDRSQQTAKEPTSGTTPPPPLRTKVMKSADQKALAPDQIIQDLQKGNLHYQHDQRTPMDDTAMIHDATGGQYPEAFVLACMDSRVPVEEIFDKGIGDLFVGRVAGNIIDEDVLGSMEYGCRIAGAKLIVVLGHESCGAIKAAIEKEELGNVTALLKRLKPAIKAAESVPGTHNTENPEYVKTVVQENIRNSIEDIMLKSPVLKDMVVKGEIKIIGAYYSLHTGEVTFLNQ